MIARILGLIVVAALFAGCSSPAFRYVSYRLFPDRVATTGEQSVATPGVDESVTIVFDRWGVPHIRARTEHDATFALGYMHGRDRRFQLESMRLLAAGRIRELVGEREGDATLSRLEVFSRLLGLYQDADQLLANATDAEVALLQAYADGINHATAVEPTPMEFRLLDVEPEPWTPRDSYLTLALVSFGLCKNWEHELGRLELVVHQLRTGGSVDRALAIWKPRVALAPHLFGEPLANPPLDGGNGVAPEVVAYLESTFRGTAAVEHGDATVASVSSADSPWDAFFRGGSASNNWAMGGDWTGTGKGAFASDPHMPHGLPALGYLAHVECDPCGGAPFRAIGAGFMGLPGLVFATNGQVAWGATSNWTDVTDLYVERLVDGSTSEYETEAGPRAIEGREEVFRIRHDDGTFATETRTVRATRHGPLVNDFVERLPEDFPLVALRRQGLTGNPIEALRALYRATDVDAAATALHGVTAMTGHWALSDTAGNVAYTPTVRLPVRRAHLGTFPAAGWTGTYEWREFIESADMPRLRNPESGFVGTANNQVMHPDSFAVPTNFEGDVPFRFQRIAALLSRGPGESSLARTRELHLDATDPGIAPLLALYAPTLERLAADDETGAAAQALRGWDGTHEPDAIAPSVWNALLAHLVERVFVDEVSPATLDFILNYFNVEPLVFVVLGDDSNPAWDDRRTESRETVDDAVEAALRDAVTALREQHGGDVDGWTWNQVAPFVLRHPFGGESLLAGYLNRELPTAGSGSTVNKHQFVRSGMAAFPIKYGPVLRINVDLADLGASRMTLPGGTSGRPASAHYDDQLSLWQAGDGVPMELDFERIETRGRLVLQAD